MTDGGKFQEFTETVEQQMKVGAISNSDRSRVRVSRKPRQIEFLSHRCNLELTYSLQISPRSVTAVCNVSLSGSAIARRP